MRDSGAVEKCSIVWFKRRDDNFFAGVGGGHSTFLATYFSRGGPRPSSTQSASSVQSANPLQFSVASVVLVLAIPRGNGEQECPLEKRKSERLIAPREPTRAANTQPPRLALETFVASCHRGFMADDSVRVPS